MVRVLQLEALQDWVIRASGFASVISMADAPAALSVVSAAASRDCADTLGLPETEAQKWRRPHRDRVMEILRRNQQSRRTAWCVEKRPSNHFTRGRPRANQRVT